MSTSAHFFKFSKKQVYCVGMAATPVAEDAPPLSRLFLQGWEVRRKIDACELASGSPERAVRERTYRLHASLTSHSFLCLRLCVYFYLWTYRSV